MSATHVIRYTCEFTACSWFQIFLDKCVVVELLLLLLLVLPQLLQKVTSGIASGPTVVPFAFNVVVLVGGLSKY